MDPSQIDLALTRIRSALEAGQVQAAIDTLTDLHPVDRADAFSDLNDEDQAVLLPRLNLEETADLLEELEDEHAAAVAEKLDTVQLADVLDEMQPDEAADVLGDLPADRAREALAEMEEAENVLPLLPYADQTAGGRMTTSFIAIPTGTTAAEAIGILRRVEPSSETPYYLYVEDGSGRMIGVLGLRDLVIAAPETKVESIMNPEVILARRNEDQEEVALRMARYDMAALPVVDRHGVVVGVITHDDVMDVVEEEATEDIYRLANVSDPYLSIYSPIRLALKKRIPWLYLSAVTALFAAWVISKFELLIAEVAVLAVFLSVVAGLGGNTATQSLAMIVRALALGEIELRHAWRTVLKEGVVGLLAGVLVGTAVGVAVWLWQGNPALGVVLGLALIGNMLVAGFVGALIPISLRALKLDPALASSVLVTTVTDSVGFALFLTLSLIALSNLR